MPEPTAFSASGGRAPHTASVAASLDHQGWEAPGDASLEALLYAVSGGVVFGAFFFHYDGGDPQINILTRNTFDECGWDATCSRLGLVQDVTRSTSVDKAEAKLRTALEEGEVPIVWVDVFTLGYEHSELGEAMWAVQPVVVVGIDAVSVRLFDRSRRLHELPLERFRAAWGRIKKDRHRMVTLDAPDPSRLPSALCAGFEDSVRLFFEKPPRGSAQNFGLRGYTRLAADVRSVKGKTAWSRTLPTARDLMAGLMTATKYGLLFWKDTSETADRALFAEALDAAASLLGRQELTGVADEFRSIGEAWKELGRALLPATIPLCAEAADVLRARHRVFLEEGLAGQETLRALDAQRAALLDEAASLDREELAAAITEVPDRLEAIRDREASALRTLAAVVEVEVG